MHADRIRSALDVDNFFGFSFLIWKVNVFYFFRVYNPDKSKGRLEPNILPCILTGY